MEMMNKRKKGKVRKKDMEKKEKIKVGNFENGLLNLGIKMRVR